MLLPVLYRGAYMAAMFAAQLILANLLQPVGLGTLSLLVLNASFLTLLTGLGSDAIAMHQLVQGKWSIEQGFSFLLKMSFLQIVLFGLMQWASLTFTSLSLLSRDADGAWVQEAFYFVGLVITEKSLVLYYTTHRARVYNLILLGAGAGYLIVLAAIIFFKIEVKNPIRLVALQSLLQGLLLIVIFLLKQKIVKIIKINWQHTFSVLRISIIVMITNIVQLLAYRIDFWLLRHYYSEYEVGIYAQANKFAGLLWVLPNILAMLLVARFSKINTAQLPVVFRLANGLNIFMMAAAAIVACVLYRFVLLPQYSAGLKAFWLMLPGYFCWALVIYFGAYFSWKGTFAVNLMASSFCMIIIFITDLILIPWYSVNGAAIANTIAYSLTLVFYLIAYKKGGLPIPSLFHFNKGDIGFLKKILH